MLDNVTSFYVICLNENTGLFVDAKGGFFYSTATHDLMQAKRYETYEAAEKDAKKTGGKVVRYKLLPYDAIDEDMEILRLAIRQIASDKDELVERLRELGEEIDIE